MTDSLSRLSTLLALLHDLRALLRDEASRADDDAPRLPPSLLDAADADDAAVAAALRSSRKISCDRLLEVVSAKLAALQAAGVAK